MRGFCQGLFSITAVGFLAIFLSLSRSAGSSNPEADLFWIFFMDKGDQKPIRVSDKAAHRRFIRSSLSEFSWMDAPVKKEYIEDLKSRGVRIRNVSRWLNAVSVYPEGISLNELAELPYVKDIRPVSFYSRRRAQADFEAVFKPGKTAAFDYGPSFGQISTIAVDSLHNIGLSGDGVLIGIMDSGFDTSHSVFSHLRSGEHILATYDFINVDSNVVDEPDAQRTHGTQVLSALAGFSEGSLIGPAFGSEFILAKTEIVLGNVEIQAEEDNWVAAAEWMESLGADIISSSIGYIDWYDTTQLDGQTAVITQAANMATSLGVVVVNAAGNEGNTSWRKIMPPADGDSVIAVGAVNSSGEIAEFSSRGPTADGRIKPDFCATGVSVFVANWAGGYGFASGTSYSTPLIAGGIALLLEGHPGWTLAEILMALKSSASNNFLPNNTYGWGIPDFRSAFYGQAGGPSGELSILIAPHPAVDSAVFYLTVAGGDKGELSIHDVSGASVSRLEVQADSSGSVRLVWDGRNDSDRRAVSGIYICNLSVGEKNAIEKFFFISNR
jgi:serine protease AprX